MKLNRIRTALLLTAGLTVLSLTACGGGSNTISSLTDSDSTTSSVATGAAAAAGTAAAAATSSVPAVTPSVVGGTGSTASPAAQPTAAPAAGTAAAPAAGTAAAPAAGTAAGTTAGTAAATAAGTAASTVEEVPDDIEASPEEEDFEAAGEGNTGRTTTDVNFRSEPDTEGGDDTVIDELSEGTEVTILGREGEFFKVQIDDVVGYIHSDYIE